MKNLIVRQITRLNNRISREIERLDGSAPCCITSGNGQIIGYLMESEDIPVYQKNIEKEFGITRSTASRVLGLMEDKGLISRSGVAHDARLKQVKLTETSRALARRMQETCSEANDSLLRGFTEAEIDTLQALLTRMQKNLE